MGSSRASCHRTRRTRRVAGAVAASAAVLCSALVALPRASHALESHAGAWLRPVDGPVVRPFQPPQSAYGPGHRGVDFAAAPGTPVRAAGDGVVQFAGSVGGTLHVTVAHGGGLRTSTSFLASIAVRRGQRVASGDVVGTVGGAGHDTGTPDAGTPDAGSSGHDGAVLHFGLRLGDRYLDPMQLFAPADLTALIRLAPAGEPDAAPWEDADERRALTLSLQLPRPAAGPVGATTGPPGDGSCGGGVPIVGAVVDALCDAGAWFGRGAGAALDAGARVLDAATAIGADALAVLESAARATVAQLRTVPGVVIPVISATPLGQLALDLVEIGTRFAGAVTAECTADAPPADGTGGSRHRVMVVAGLDSSGRAGADGPTVGLDVAALGYRADEGEVRYFSYAADGGPYDPRDTHGPFEVAALGLLDQLRAMQREQPGREVDLVAHSQGGIVVDVLLTQFYRAEDPSLPPLGTVVTLSTPHEGAPLATAGARIRGSRFGKAVLDTIGRAVPGMPPPNAIAVQQLSERSRTIARIQRRGVPEHFQVTSIGATEDLVVPATNISMPGATEVVVPVDAPFQHSAIVQDPAALRAVRAALEGRPPPCVDLGTALRGAVAPVLVTRASRTLGAVASLPLGGSP